MANIDRWMPLITLLTRGMIKMTQTARRSQLDAVPQVSDCIVFLGDSITEQGMWSEWFPGWPTQNRGVGGETISQVRARLDRALTSPRAISLLIGTNDLSGLGESRKVDDIARQMRALVDEIQVRAPAVPLFINGVLPRSTLYRDRILALNAHYKSIAMECGATYLDIWPALADSNGAIRPECTADGIHLSGAGYRGWTDLLRERLAPFATVRRSI